LALSAVKQLSAEHKLTPTTEFGLMVRPVLAGLVLMFGLLCAIAVVELSLLIVHS